MYTENYLHFFHWNRNSSQTELHTCLLCTEKMQGQMPVHKRIAARTHVQRICVFSLASQTIFPKNRDKGHRKGWVEVSMGMKEKAKVPATEISMSNTPDFRMNRWIIAFWDHVYKKCTGKRTNCPVAALNWVYRVRFWWTEGCRHGFCVTRPGAAPCVSISEFFWFVFLHILTGAIK